MTATIGHAHPGQDITAFAGTGPLVYRIADLAGPNGLLRMSRATVYRQIKAGRIRIIKQGDTTLITRAALADYIRLLEREAADAEHDPSGAAGNDASRSTVAERDGSQ